MGEGCCILAVRVSMYVGAYCDKGRALAFVGTMLNIERLEWVPTQVRLNTINLTSSILTFPLLSL
jgi:hypothetical protein